MNRLLRLDWFRRHKAVAIMTVIVAAAVFTVWMIHGTTNSQARFATAVAARKSAETLLESKQLAQSDRQCRLAVGILTELAARSSDHRIRFEQAQALETLAMIQSAADQPDEAEAFYHKAVREWSWLLGVEATDAEVRWRFARCLARWARILSESGRWEDAEDNLRIGKNVCRTRVGNAPPDDRLDRQLVSIMNQRGSLLLRAGRSKEALASFDEAVQAAKELIGRPSSTTEDRELLISSLTTQARAYSSTGQRDAAVRLLGEARLVAERLSAASSASDHHRDLLATQLATEAIELQGDSRRAAEARNLLERAFAIRESLVAASPAEPEYLARLAEDKKYAALADSFINDKLYEKAEEQERKALSCQLRLAHLQPEVAAFRFGRGRALHNLAELLRQRGRARRSVSV